MGYDRIEYSDKETALFGDYADYKLQKKLKNIEEKYEDINEKLFDPAVVSDIEQYRKLLKEQKRIEPVVEKYREYKKALATVEESDSLLEEGGPDKEFLEMVHEERDEAAACLEKTGEELCRGVCTA